ncbi:hypothetical protein AUK11_01760 [bacterium CG2_30_37_16]|nr:MAG: hypothetical protein AUK11_01760 [bacterium CG2_30_37_16]PIP30516.1 MAG: NUDIX hydrolase [bacterium (Candidatus Howlettbacteria) CG23_combo_of_CG06-09_8_20_14_all_37_9]PIX99436.1 MAG: NUDIX hydrolase [bacterium (Candidatus Howlettbacteria) CG_4_10_14_3_um_filter_37_10]
MPIIEEESFDPEINPKAAIAVDVVIFSVVDEELKVLLIQRDFWPFHGDWTLLGGYASPKETLEETAKRELFSQTGIENVYLEQCHVMSDPGRDSRTRVVSISFMAVINSQDYQVPYLGEKARLGWFGYKELPPLMFDHAQIIQAAYIQLRQRLKYSNIAWRLLSKEFTLTELQQVYEIISGKKLDKRNFRKKVLVVGMVIPTKKRQHNVSHRPAELFRFKK